ncbi:Uncharacterised protein [Burkholderia cepacia]|uniref:Uncharacterized protein n=1 Tax=Burkholderia cepacia TaxID=292 RepID=A0AAE8NN41_BURCE|nr:hypothetical protein [Burkholderia cepacia]POM20650.1 hypothetical protein CSX04_02066 [Burkholderia cepacia]SQA62010.1 Uncharacterised protein [Burkholderia cepacia]
MTPRPALSTPRQLPRKRETAKSRAAVKLASVNGTSIQSDCDWLTPAKAIQKDEAPLARRKPIQINEALADTRQGRLARLDALRIEIRALITEISHSADVELLDLMADEIGSFARHKAAQDTRTWATTAGITLETSLMQLGRALLASNHAAAPQGDNA